MRVIRMQRIIPRVIAALLVLLVPFVAVSVRGGVGLTIRLMYGGKLIAIALMASAIFALSAGSAAAAEIRILALQSPQIVMAEVGAEFERKTGHKLTQLLTRTDMPPEANRRIDSGEPFDVAFVLPP